MTSDLDWMRRAIRLSKRGWPAPGAHVGCVLVKDGALVGEGFHPYPGGPHAEIVALQSAGEAARGATAYVSLEPCNHFGRTGPCSQALIAAGVSRVVAACADPNPVAVGGAQALRGAGIPVELGLLAEEAREANALFHFAHAAGRPVVVVKAGMSLDGRIALPSGESQWITSEQSRRHVMRLRAECGVVLVGRNTVTLDHPKLTVRGIRLKRQPLRVILDPLGRLDPSEPVFAKDADVLWCVRRASNDLQTEIPGSGDQFELEQVLAEVGKRGYHAILVEGGGQTIGSFIRARLVDRLELFVAGKVLGAGPSWIEGGLGTRLAEVPEFRIVSTRRCGPDLWLTAAPRW